MKPIPQEEIDKAADNHSKRINIKNYNAFYPDSYRTFSEISIEDFKAGVKFAEKHLYSQIENIIIENQKLKIKLDEITDNINRLWMRQ